MAAEHRDAGDADLGADLDAEVLAHLLAFVEQSRDFIGVSDPWGRLLYLNPAAAKRLGVADATGLTLADLFPVETFGFYYEVVRPELLRSGAWSGEVLVNAQGVGPVPMYVSTTGRIGPGGETNGGVVYAHELRPTAAAGIEGAEVDTATSLLTEAAFRERATSALAESAGEHDACALVLADVVGPRADADPAGSENAAGIMRTLAGRLSRLARSLDIIGRLGDRRIGLLLRGVRSEAEALRIASTARELLTESRVPTAGGDVVVQVSCGVALARKADTLAELIERAAASAADEPEPGAPPAAAARMAGQFDAVTMDQFRVAMSHGDVVPYVQPVAELQSDGIIGYRGFAQWHHRTLGVLGPSSFVDMIADTELATVIDLFVAREAVAVVLLMTRDLPLHLYTPVSRALVADVRTEQHLSEIADAYFVSPTHIHLQVARHLLDNWTPALHDALYSLRARGFRIVLTGVERATDLEAVADVLDELQITRRLTHAAATDADARATLTETVRRARARGLAVVGAGADREEHREVLAAAGCDAAFGELVGAAEPAATAG